MDVKIKEDNYGIYNSRRKCRNSDRIMGTSDHSVFKGEEILKYDIYSAEGYCFWEVQQPENYDEEGNLKSPAERVYARVAYTCFSTIEELNANFISVPIEEGYEIV